MFAKVDDWLDRFPGGRCALCGLPAAAGRLCAACLADLPWIEHPCGRCGAPLPPTAACGRCAGCDLALAGLDRVLGALVYEWPVDSLVAAAKFHGRMACAHALGQALATCLIARQAAGACDVVVPVPLHPARLASRGYNQAAVIATAAARATRIPLATRLCTRRVNTPAQSGLAGAARRANLRGAFLARGELRGQRVAIVDDVVTTGHTLSAVARALRRAGASGVEAWCATRVVSDQVTR